MSFRKEKQEIFSDMYFASFYSEIPNISYDRIFYWRFTKNARSKTIF